ncbi:MAG: hypothetical protein Q9M36_09395 [Sulfurovum sp.]|nr:hypothetical protein [Sulfurovum sp.]
MFDIQGNHYIYVQRMAHNIMLQDNRPENYYFEIAVSLGIFLITLLLLLLFSSTQKTLSSQTPTQADTKICPRRYADTY